MPGFEPTRKNETVVDSTSTPATPEVPRPQPVADESPSTPMFDPRWRRGVDARLWHLKSMRYVPLFCLLPFLVLLVISDFLISEIPGALYMMLPIFLLMAGYSLFVTPRLVRREQRIKDIVPKHRGLICPVCVVPLETTESVPHCPNCAASYATHQAEMYWEAYGLDAMRASALFYVLPTGPRSPLWARVMIGLPAALSSKANRAPVAFAFGMGLSLALAMGLPMAMMTSFSFMRGFMLAGTLVGLILFMLGKGFRVGDELHCLKCDYQMAPQGRPSPRCPECGADWTKRTQVARGRLVRRPALMVMGVLLCAATYGLMFLGISDTFYRQLPTSFLLWNATGRDSDEFWIWQELSARALTPEETTSLAMRLVNTRRKKNKLDSMAERWLSGCVIAKTIPQELIDRYYNEAVEMKLEVVSRNQVNRQWVIQPRVNSRAGSFSAVSELNLLVEGIYVNGQAISQPETQGTRCAWFCTKPSIENGDGEHIVCPKYTVEIVEESPTRIELAYWLVETPSWLVTPITWTDNLTPTSTQTLSQARRFVAEFTIPADESPN